MKKRMIRIFGIGLIVTVLASLLLMSAPASAANPLQWAKEVIPTTTGKILQPGLDILDISVNPDGETIYAVGTVTGAESATATITTTFVDGGDGAAEVYSITYTNQDGTGGRTATLSVTMNATATSTFAVSLQTGDTGIKDITALAATTEDATAGIFTIDSDTSATLLYTYDVTGGTTADGNAVTDTTKKIYKSTNGGSSWTDLSDATGLDITNTSLVACAPDDPDLVMVVDIGATGPASAYVSEDGGIEFGDVSLPTTGNLTDLDVSAAVGGVHYAAVCGMTAGGAAGGVWYYKLGIGGAWTPSQTLEGFNTSADSGYGTTNEVWAIAFSPNFASDQVLTAVSDNGTNVFFEMLSVSTTAADSVWNEAAGFENYPVTMADKDGTALLAVTGASIALAPTYLGGDEVERVAFVGLTSGTVTERGVIRLKDYVDKHILTEEQQIYSIAYDGTTVVAGEDSCVVWRCSDPLSTIPTFYPSTTTKSPSSSVTGVENPVLAWMGTSVVAATSGYESAFSISLDDGKSFNDISLIDTAIASIDDIAVAADVGKVYMVTNDGIDTSVWRRASDWNRVLTVKADTDYIVRIAPEDPDVVYVAEQAGKAVYYGKEGGDSKWYSRRSAHNIQDMAVESDDVAYIAKASSDAVIKTTNSGFTWGAAEDTELVDGYIYSIKSLGEDQVIVGSTAGYISYSTDGNDSWEKIEQQIATGATNTVVAASGLTEGSYLFAASSTAGSSVYRWPVGQAQSLPWKDLMANPLAPNYAASGYGANSIAMQSGALYIGTTGAAGSLVLRIVEPFMPDSMVTIPIMASSWSSTGPAGPLAALDVSATAEFAESDDTLTMWVASGGTLYFYMDCLALASATLHSPAANAVTKTNPLMGTAYDVTLTWDHIPFAEEYEVHVCFDPACMEQTGNSPYRELMAIGLPVATLVVDGGDLTPGTTYYWRVHTSTTGPLVSKWSEIRSFTVEAAAAVAPTIGSPENGSTITTANPAFSWSPVSRATMYEFQLAVGTNFASALHTQKLAETGIRPAVKLDPGMTYFWRVRAIEPIVGEWSTIANFTVAEPEEAAPPPVVVEEVPPPQINIPAAPPATEIVLPEAPAPPAQVAPGYIWAVIIIGAVLVIAVIVLIVRTRRTV